MNETQIDLICLIINQVNLRPILFSNIVLRPIYIQRITDYRKLIALYASYAAAGGRTMSMERLAARMTLWVMEP